MNIDELEKLAKAVKNKGNALVFLEYEKAADPDAILKLIQTQRLLMEENHALYERVKLMGEVVRAAEETEKKFMDIDDGFFTGLVPPEFAPVSKALRALNQSDAGIDAVIDQPDRGSD